MSENSTTFPNTTTTFADYNVTFPSSTFTETQTYKSSPNNITSTNCCSESNTHQNFNFSTTTTLTTEPLELSSQTLTSEPTGDPVTESVHKFQRKIWAHDGQGGYTIYNDDQYTTPTSILILNFFLIIFLMIVIGIAVYPAVKKYCDSTFFQCSGNGNRYWIEDNEEVISVLTSRSQCSFALLNRPGSSSESIKRIAVSPDDSSSACSLDVLTDARRN